MQSQIFHIRNEKLRSIGFVAKRFDDQLAEFLRKQRGDKTYAEFAKKLGISDSTLFRLEHSQQSATLQRLEQIMEKLKCGFGDIFPNNL